MPLINGHAPIALSDLQMRMVMERAKMLRRYLRSAFLQAVAEELRGQEIGDASVHRAAIAAARKVELEQAWKAKQRNAPPAIDGTGNDMSSASARGAAGVKNLLEATEPRATQSI
jgi:hypothetical protein